MLNPRHFALTQLSPEDIIIVVPHDGFVWCNRLEWRHRRTGVTLLVLPEDSSRNIERTFHGVCPTRQRFPGVPDSAYISYWSWSVRSHVVCAKLSSGDRLEFEAEVLGAQS